MPSTKAQTKTDTQAATLNPFASTAVAGGQNVYLQIHYANVSPNLPGLVDAIETFYGAGKVTADADVGGNARGNLRLRVIP